MFSADNVPDIVASEKLIRFVVDSRDIKQSDAGKYIHWRAFRPNRGGVSVTRALHCSDDELKALGDTVARNARKKETAIVLAYAVATVEECVGYTILTCLNGQEINQAGIVNVVKDPRPDNPNHADIRLTDQLEEYQKISLDHVLVEVFKLDRLFV